MQVRYNSDRGKLRTISTICKWASQSCMRGCTSPGRNCIKILVLIRRGYLDRLPEDPGSHFVHWSEDIQREYELALEREKDQTDVAGSKPAPLEQEV